MILIIRKLKMMSHSLMNMPFLMNQKAMTVQKGLRRLPIIRSMNPHRKKRQTKNRILNQDKGDNYSLLNPLITQK